MSYVVLCYCICLCRVPVQAYSSSTSCTLQLLVTRDSWLVYLSLQYYPILHSSGVWIPRPSTYSLGVTPLQHVVLVYCPLQLQAPYRGLQRSTTLLPTPLCVPGHRGYILAVSIYPITIYLMSLWHHLFLLRSQIP